MLAAAQPILSAFLGAEAARSKKLEPIHGGQSTASLYRFGHDGQTYVLRLLAPVTRPKHHHEVSLTRAAGTIGWAPACTSSPMNRRSSTITRRSNTLRGRRPRCAGGGAPRPTTVSTPLRQGRGPDANVPLRAILRIRATRQGAGRALATGDDPRRRVCEATRQGTAAHIWAPVPPRLARAKHHPHTDG